MGSRYPHLSRLKIPFEVTNTDAMVSWLMWMAETKPFLDERLGTPEGVKLLVLKLLVLKLKITKLKISNKSADYMNGEVLSFATRVQQDGFGLNNIFTRIYLQPSSIY